jgi:hypothetical protein
MNLVFDRIYSVSNGWGVMGFFSSRKLKNYSKHGEQGAKVTTGLCLRAQCQAEHSVAL